MVGEKSMQRFQNEYEKLYRALKTSYESEKRLVKRCKELNETIVGNATRVKAALRLTQEDSSTISLLKKEVDRAWKLVETAKEKEERARKIIQDLRGEIAHLTKIVEGGTSLSVSADNNVQKMIDEKEALKKDLAQKAEQFADAEMAKAEIAEKANQLQLNLFKKESEFKTIKQENEQNMIKINTLERTQEDEKSKAAALRLSEEQLNGKIRELNVLIQSLEDKNQNLTQNMTQAQTENSQLVLQVRDNQSKNNQLESEYSKLNKNFRELSIKDDEKQKELDTATKKHFEMVKSVKKV